MKIGAALRHVALIFFCLCVALPIFWLVRTSLVPPEMSYDARLWPAFSTANYQGLFADNGFGRNYLNSLIVACGSVLIATPFAALTGYAFARFRTGGRAARFAVLATQMLPPVALALPTFMIYRQVGLTNSVSGLVIAYAVVNLPFLTWILMGFFEGIPSDLEEAAITDGATDWQAFLLVVLPVARPGIAAALVLGFILAWNEFLFALILSGPSTATVPVALAALQTSNGVEIGKVAAGVALAIVPLMIVSRFIQKYLVRGLSFGGVG
ncbi:carbohydrate ABC transporter permease [Citreicella sp. C3M06]|uniref:carbohydrate ABC transporter permease n=1 Tax=Citreicella sp. C3M06 TaxID=2841564 RepID=UPI001C0A113F|nr:carbohydrate ABC transporter permease [Citreicella sp. C3M06]MBU2961431.1 carbohydrate ABC transporter permease [Citreicella sp. C3M06]